MSLKKIVVFVSESEYAPAKQFIHLLGKSSGSFQIHVLKPSDVLSVPTTSEEVELTPDNSTSLEAVREVFQNCEAAVMLIAPADLSQVKQLTHSFLKFTRETEIHRLAWVAPACPEESRLGKLLAIAETSVRSQEAETLVLRHAPLFSDLLIQRKELKYRRTLSLPLNNRALPWIDPRVISEGLYKWIIGKVNNNPPYVLMGPTHLTGKDIARELSEVLKQNANSRKFLAKHFQSVELDERGLIDVEKLFPYLLELGYSHDEARTILEEADGEKSGSMAFEEFLHKLQEHFHKILATIPTEVRYLNEPHFAVFYDWMTRGMDENTAQSRLELISALSEFGLCDLYNNKQELIRWLGRESISFKEWANEHAFDLLNVHFLPGRRILTLNEGHWLERPALTSHLLLSNKRMLVSQSTLDGEALEWQWADEDTSYAEVVCYTPKEGGKRVLELKDHKIFKLSVRGGWAGSQLAVRLLFQNKSISPWQISWFREHGELIEELPNLEANDVVCDRTTMVEEQPDILRGMETQDSVLAL
ncbi:hypothetical protein [Scytonema sp. NUACC26]|uniref:hypothetical protein n=1 Tax=Scytonema sp. NUACC26 TaxID=3140176 RepID=UPI0034DBDB09